MKYCVVKVDLFKYDQSWYFRGKSNIIVLLWMFIQGTLLCFSLHNMYRWNRWRSFLIKIVWNKDVFCSHRKLIYALVVMILKIRTLV